MDQATILRTASFVGLSSSMVLSGVYFSSSQMVVPILFRFPANVSADIFSEFYYRGLAVVAPLAAVSATSFGTAAYINPKKRTGYSVAAVLAILPIVWTALFMAPTINQLLDAAKDDKVRAKVGEAGVLALLKKWHWMNFLRAGVALASGVTSIFVLTA